LQQRTFYLALAFLSRPALARSAAARWAQRPDLEARLELVCGDVRCADVTKRALRAALPRCLRGVCECAPCEDADARETGESGGCAGAAAEGEKTVGRGSIAGSEVPQRDPQERAVLRKSLSVVTRF
jgi:hypothetical protein